MRILVLDETPVFRRGLVMLLAGEPDLEVAWAGGDPAEAVTEARTHLPDVIVLDAELSGTSAVEVVRRLKGAAPTAAIIGLGGALDEEAVFELLSAGAIGYLLKSREPTELVHGVRAAGRGDAMIDPAVTQAVVRYLSQADRERRLGRPARHGGLTEREVEVLRLVCQGRPNKQIAAELAISDRTVENHLRNIYRKLEVSDRTQATLSAITAGLVSLA